MRDRKKLKGHIRAAKAWLGDAEHSLDSENDVQSDLKVMLARAELSQMEESEKTSRLKRWGARLAPVAAAAVIAVGILSFTQIGQPARETGSVEQESAALPSVDKDPMLQPGKTDAAEVEDSPKDIPAIPPEAKAAKAEETTAVPQVPVEKTAAVPAAEPARAVQSAEPPAERAKPEVPDSKRQQLMQTAGQVLRQ